MPLTIRNRGDVAFLKYLSAVEAPFIPLVNVDLVSTSPSVWAYGIRKGLRSRPVVSMRAILARAGALDTVGVPIECHPILRPGGIMRVVVPDREGIVREYLRARNQAVAGDTHAAADHRGMQLEMYDRTVHSASDGERSSAFPPIRINTPRI